MSDEPELIQGSAFAFIHVYFVFTIITKRYGANPALLTGYFQLKAEVTMRMKWSFILGI